MPRACRVPCALCRVPGNQTNGERVCRAAKTVWPQREETQPTRTVAHTNLHPPPSSSSSLFSFLPKRRRRHFSSPRPFVAWTLASGARRVSSTTCWPFGASRMALGGRRGSEGGRRVGAGRDWLVLSRLTSDAPPGPSAGLRRLRRAARTTVARPMVLQVHRARGSAAQDPRRTGRSRHATTATHASATRAMFAGLRVARARPEGTPSTVTRAVRVRPRRRGWGAPRQTARRGRSRSDQGASSPSASARTCSRVCAVWGTRCRRRSSAAPSRSR